MIGKEMQDVINIAITEVNKRHHEYLTLEHLLYGIVSETTGQKIIESCGGNTESIRAQLEQFFSTYLDTLDEAIPENEIPQTLAIQRVLENTIAHIHSSGRTQIEVGDVLAALLEEEESWAAYCLKKQGVTRIAVLEFISYGLPHSDLGNGDFVKKVEEGSEEKSPLTKYTIELTQKARNGEIDPLVGRDMEISRTIEVLARRKKNNPLYVGDPGTGKTAIAEGLALRIISGNVPEEFTSSLIFSLDMGALLAGARYRGDFEGRIKSVLSELSKQPKAILFIDEIHTIIGAGSTNGSAVDAANLLKPILTNGKLRCIGSTTHEEFRNHFAKDRALARRFQRIDIHEPSQDDCIAILKGLQSRYEKHHKVKYTPAALHTAVKLSARHITDRMLPDKAIDVLDEAGAAVHLRAGNKSKVLVTRQDIEKVISRMTGIPMKTVSGKEKDRLKNLKKDLSSHIYGQNEAIDKVTKAIFRSRAGLNRGNRPSGSFLFYGPTGVGKTELAKQIAENLNIAFLRFDMSEYMEKHAVARLIGSPPGYVGFEQGGLLTEAVKKTPYAVVLLDEIEKAHPDIYNILLQVMDYGTLTDNTGRKTDFHNIILIMTSNAGAREMGITNMGFVSDDTNTTSHKGRKAVESVFSPEFRNRLDAIVPFNNLSPELMSHIVEKNIKELTKGLAEKRVSVMLSSEAKKWLAKKGYDKKLGARPLQRLLRESLEDQLAEEILFGKLVKGGRVTVKPPLEEDSKLVVMLE